MKKSALRPTTTSSNAADATPTMVNETASTRMVCPRTSAAPNPRRQKRYEMTATAESAASSSRSSRTDNTRPAAGPIPRTSKKFPETNRPAEGALPSPVMPVTTAFFDKASTPAKTVFSPRSRS
jgi:hypothetical protein